MAALRIGVISDTHGLLRPEAMAALRGSDWIIHAGDIGSPEILSALRSIAPLSAVRGNVDRGDGVRNLPATQAIEVGGFGLYVLHILDDLDLDPAAAGFQTVIHGHSHQPSIRYIKDILYLNPGSAGPRRFRLPVTLARILIDGTAQHAEIIHLLPDAME